MQAALDYLTQMGGAGRAYVGAYPPDLPMLGDMWLNSADNSFHIYDGDQWIVLVGELGDIDGGIF